VKCKPVGSVQVPVCQQIDKFAAYDPKLITYTQCYVYAIYVQTLNSERLMNVQQAVMMTKTQYVK
jgi:hypothetical protein